MKTKKNGGGGENIKLDKLTTEQKRKYLKWLQYKNYEKNPELWVADKSPLKLSNYQLEIVKQMFRLDKPINETIVLAPRGGGKTSATTIGIACFIDIYETLGIDWAVQTTAPSQRVLINALWKEINKILKHLKNMSNDYKPLKLRFEGEYGQAVSQTVTPGQEVNMEGMHASRMLIVLDEAKGVNEAVYESLRGTYSEAGVGGNRASVVAISTPGAKAGRLWDIYSKRDKYPSWNIIKITQEQALKAGRISELAVEKAKNNLGESSARYQNDWLGNFATDESESFLPESWIKKSNRRWEDLNDRDLLYDGGHMVVGLDPARHGSDKTAIAVYNPRVNAVIEIFSESCTENMMDLIPLALSKGKKIVIDSDGLGASLFDAFKNYIENIGANDVMLVEFRGGGKAVGWKDQLGNEAFNCRSAMYCDLNQALQPENNCLALPPSDDLASEILLQKYQVDMAGGKIKIESKDKVIKRLGRSPDLSDAVAMSLWEPAKLGYEYLPSISVTEIRENIGWD